MDTRQDEIDLANDRWFEMHRDPLPCNEFEPLSKNMDWICQICYWTIEDHELEDEEIEEVEIKNKGEK